MKIQANKIKPGMVICRTRIGGNKRKYDDICLVTVKKGFSKVDYTHLDFDDAYTGLLIGTIDGAEEVRVITGSQRKAIIKKITDDVFRSLNDTENIVDTLRLIEAMER